MAPADLFAIALCVGALAAQAPLKVDLRRQQGRVTDVLGEPVPAARFEVVFRGAVIGRGASDAEGIYEVRAPAQPGAELVVEASGKAEVRLPWGGLSTGAVRNLVLEDGCRIAGAIVDAFGRPVVGGTVVAVGGTGRQVVATDAEGGYVLPAVPMRELHLCVWGADRCAEATLWPRGDMRRDFELPLFGSERRRVRVEGLPPAVLAGAVLEVTSRGTAMHQTRGRVELRPDGTAELLPRQTSLVRLLVPGYEAEPRGYLVEPGVAGELVFATQRLGDGGGGTVLRGRLVAADDGGQGGREFGVAGVMLVAEDRLFGHAGACVTDDDGRFTLATTIPVGGFCRLGLRLGEWQFVDQSARSSGGFSWYETTTDPRPETLKVVRGGTARAELRGPDGNRFAFAEVVVVPSDRPQSICSTLTSDRLGRFDLAELGAGEFMLAAVSQRGEVAVTEIAIELGEKLPIQGWNAVATGAIEGRIVDRRGEPIPGVEVRLIAPEFAAGIGEPMAGRPEAVVRTDRDGRFRCRGLHGGEWLVRLPGEAAVAAERVEVDAGGVAEVDFTLSR
ncbi:MAG: carboxypeptidase regulatory-like domain-containing protein [Planctomycetes bacterium]|nr:carboxypeptidase regulatory-like domain-containing protein [Planctomycetota bacterium]